MRETSAVSGMARIRWQDSEDCVLISEEEEWEKKDKIRRCVCVCVMKDINH